MFSAARLLRCVLAGEVESATCALCLREAALLAPSQLVSVARSASACQLTVHRLAEEVCIAEIPGDLTSKKICTACVDQMWSFYLFKRKCIRSASTLRSLVGVLERETVAASEQFIELYLDSTDSLENYSLNIALGFETFDIESGNEPKLTPSKLSKDHRYFSCDHCQRTFKSKQYLGKHIKSKHAPILDNLSNDECKTTQNDYRNFNIPLEDIVDGISTPHTKQSSGDVVQSTKEPIEVFQCRKCAADLPTVKALWVHLKKHQRNPYHLCRLCPGQWNGLPELLKHWQSKHSDQAPFTPLIITKTKKSFLCCYCNQKFKCQFDFKNHVYSQHASKDEWLCNNCSGMFANRWAFNIHKCESVQTSMKESILLEGQCCKEEKKEERDESDGAFDTTEGIVEEMYDGENNFNVVSKSNEHNPRVPDPFVEDVTHICNICSKMFKNERALLIHQFRRHNQEKQCAICNIKYNASHACRFACTECAEFPCVHHKYLKAFVEADREKPNSKHKCMDCSYLYRRRGDLMQHINRYHLLRLSHLCVECDTKWPSRKALKDHTSSQHPKKQCPHCNLRFRNSLFESHVEECGTLPKPFCCKICEGRFISQQELDIHKRAHLPRLFSCPTCSLGFRNCDERRLHQFRYHNTVAGKRSKLKTALPSKTPEKFPCAKCGTTFASRKESLEHEMTHPSDAGFMCPVCNKIFGSRSERRECMRMHKDSSTEMCPLCGRKFSKLGLQAHLKQHLSKGEAVDLPEPEARRVLPKIYMCDVCGSMHGSPGAVKLHKERHKKQEKCKYCSKLVWKNHMRKHTAVHENVPSKLIPKVKLQCPDCDFSTFTYVTYEGHINRIHRKIEPYECDKCGKTFCTKNHLVAHLTVHSGIVRDCTRCRKQFRSARGLELHMRMHRGELAHACEYCDMRFVTAGKMRAHQSQAHFEPRFRCALCDRRFYRLADARKHIQGAHGGKGGGVIAPMPVRRTQRGLATKSSTEHVVKHELD